MEPSSETNLLAQGIALHNGGKLSEAESFYAAFLTLHPDHMEAINLLATLYAQSGRFEEGLLWLNKALDISPGNLETIYNLGLLTQKMGRFDEAIAYYEQALSLHPDYVEALVNRGVTLNKTARYQEALADYDKAISLNPHQAISHYNKGLSLLALKRYEEALGSFDEAIALKSNHALAFSNRGVALHRLERDEEALVSFDMALTFNPHHATTHYNRALTLQTLKRYEEAIAGYSRTIELDPNSPDSYNNRADCLNRLGRYEEALENNNKAVELAANNADYYYNRANILREMNRYNEALANYERSIALDPDMENSHSNRGVTLSKLNKNDEALESYDKAIALKSQHDKDPASPDRMRMDGPVTNQAEIIKSAVAEAHNNRGITLKEMGKFEEALKSHDKAIEIDPEYAEAYSNRGVLLQEMRRYDEAEESFNKAIAINNHENAYWNKAVLKLLLGEYEEGWKLYEWRWRTVLKAYYKEGDQYLWTGQSSLQNKVILIHAEQGFGDTIQLCRYVPYIAAMGAHVILRVQPALKDLMRTVPGAHEITTHDDPYAPNHVHCPFFSLPLAFKTTVDTVPNNIPYLSADPEKIKFWQEKLGSKTKTRIGLVWSGATGHVNDAKRSIPLHLLTPLLEGDYEYHSLQKEYRKADSELLPKLNIQSHSEHLHNFTDTAALITAMDLVISVDTSVAHLAGALGKPLWILIAYSPDYRWMMNREDTPWYPSARLFRQQNFGDWEEVIRRVATKLNIAPRGTSEKLNKAISLHRAGKLDEAETIYQALLKADPNYVEVLSLMALMCAQYGQWQDGLGLVDKAIAIKPYYAEAHVNRGLILQNLGQSEEALRSYDNAIVLEPSYTEAYRNRGVILSALKRYGEAVTSYDKAIALDAKDASTYYNRGNALKELERYEEAINSYDKAIELKPDYAEAYNNRGLVALKQLKRFDEALASFNKAIALKEDYGEAYDNRGLALRRLNQPEEALKNHEMAIALKPDYAGAYDNRGATLHELDRHQDALASFDKAIALKPDFAEAHNSRGFILQKLQRYDEALASFNKAIALKTDYADAYWNKGVLKLLLGELREGWQLYEWRWKSANKKGARTFDKPLWLGKESLKNKTLFVYAEQGLGDTIQLCRYIPVLEKLGAKIILEVPASLVTLMATLKASHQILPQGSALPEFDYQCPIFSVPLALDITLDNIIADVPYLHVNAAKRQIWQGKLGQKTKPRIGLVWSGDTKHQNDRNRSIPFKTFLPLFKDSFEFHSLQKEVRSYDKPILENSPVISHNEDLNDFSDTAALANEMDIIISIDTSVAHLAGALGKKIWILIPYAPDYRWLLERQDSPWYPTAVLFRQENIGDWDNVIRRLKANLLS